ncbi:hypothetical protein DFH94DRAFT_740288 [Russula ochroleuca]|uniref:Uncharacterized protein n=1 Tax=Russula ochroleuca TaxID=152965 RepID=A0A9P5MVV5_9AGAM|nr:hypothetical protein DFH94DRAFT_740288 [Russula ochroleuca]
MRTSLLAFLIFLSAALVHAAVLKGLPDAQHVDDNLQGSPSQPNTGASAHRRLLSSLFTQRRTSGDSDSAHPRRHRRRRQHRHV